MAEITFNLFTIVFGTLIFGIGYIGIALKYFIFKENFYGLKVFDKIVQSFILGTISFIFTVYFGYFEIAFLTEEMQLVQFVFQHPMIFVVQVFVVIILVTYWISLEAFSKIKFSNN